jgi:hypothetical protein
MDLFGTILRMRYTGGSAMLQFFWNRSSSATNHRGPLDHPSLLMMTSDQLADLPLTPEWPHAFKLGEYASESLANEKIRLCG